jgi:pilus assembly protein Flp/PilA
MRDFKEAILRFLAEEQGPTAVEYAVMLALVIMVCFAAIGTLGTATNAKFEEAAAAFTAGN